MLPVASFRKRKTDRDVCISRGLCGPSVQGRQAGGSVCLVTRGLPPSASEAPPFALGTVPSPHFTRRGRPRLMAPQREAAGLSP